MHTCNSTPLFAIESDYAPHPYNQSHGCILNLTLPAIYQPFGNRLPTRTIQKALAVCIRLRSCVRYRYIRHFDWQALSTFIDKFFASCRSEVRSGPNTVAFEHASLTQPCSFSVTVRSRVLIGIGSQPAGDFQKPFDTCPICWLYMPAFFDLVELNCLVPGYASFRIFLD